MIKIAGQILLLVSLLIGCTPKQSETDTRVAVAKVYGKVLYEDDLLPQIPYGASFEDSVSIRNSILNAWIDRQLLVHQAELNLSEEDQDVSMKLEQYRSDLLIFSYQKQLLTEKLDTVISEHEIETYYNENKDQFRLADYIVKVHYVVVDSATFKNKKVRKWLMSDEEKDIAKLDEFCHMYSSKFSLEDNWQYFFELLNNVPIVSYNIEKLLKNKKLIEFYDNGYLYLVRLVDYKLKDGVSPLSLEKTNIKRIILNNRKLLFLENLKRDIYTKAKKTREIEVFIP